jgi:hypothetical protein
MYIEVKRFFLLVRILSKPQNDKTALSPANVNVVFGASFGTTA